MKIKVLDLCVVDENKQVYNQDVEEVLYYDGGDWDGYLEKINSGNLDGYYLEDSDVDTSVFVILDGGEAIRLIDGQFVNVCWRGSVCRMWNADAEEQEYWSRKLGVEVDYS